MHGIVNRSIQQFIVDVYGASLWAEIAVLVGAPADGFEALLQYDDTMTLALIETAALHLGRRRESFLEDLGAHLISRETLRRLLRFGGMDYTDFLFSLNELQGRAQMALPDLELPSLSLRARSDGQFTLEVRAETEGWGAVFTGLLRAMADDYGALVLIEMVSAEPPRRGRPGIERVEITLHEARFASGRRFDLVLPQGVAS